MGNFSPRYAFLAWLGHKELIDEIWAWGAPSLEIFALTTRFLLTLAAAVDARGFFRIFAGNRRAENGRGATLFAVAVVVAAAASFVVTAGITGACTADHDIVAGRPFDAGATN